MLTFAAAAALLDSIGKASNMPNCPAIVFLRAFSAAIAAAADLNGVYDGLLEAAFHRTMSDRALRVDQGCLTTKLARRPPVFSFISSWLTSRT